jgi:hypothetical protein
MLAGGAWCRDGVLIRGHPSFRRHSHPAREDNDTISHNADNNTVLTCEILLIIPLELIVFSLLEIRSIGAGKSYDLLHWVLWLLLFRG